MRHWAIVAAATVLFLGQTAMGSQADLTYDPANGWVWLDQSEADGGYIDSFVLRTSDDPGFVDWTVVPLAYWNYESTATETEISQTNTKPEEFPGPGFSFHVDGVFELGPHFPTGKDLNGLQTFLTEATYNSGEDFDLIVIPEPLTTVSLLVGGALLAGIRRKRRRAA